MKLKLSLSIIIFFLLINEYTSSQVLLSNPICIEREDGSVIQYYLELNNKNAHEPRTLFLFLQGSDYNSVRGLPSLNIIKSIYPNADVLTIEKYGITDTLSYSTQIRGALSDDYAKFDTPLQRVYDAERVIEILWNNYNYDSLIVLGGSEGATVAYILASESQRVNATITIGGGGRFFMDDVICSIEATDLPNEEKIKEIEGFKSFSQFIISQDSLDFTMSDHGFNYWKTILNIDQQEIISRVSTPILILQGGKDISVSPEKTTEMVGKLREIGKSNIDYYFYPEYDHSLNVSEDETAREKVISDIRNWIQKL